MKYYMKQNVSFFQDFEIKDEKGKIAFKVHEKRWSWGQQCILSDGETGEELAEVKERLMNFLPTLDIYFDGVQVATIKKKLSFFKPRYEMEGLDWQITGDVWAHNYEIIDRGGAKIVSIQKRVWSWTDTFEFNIHKENIDPALVIAVILAIDLALDRDAD